MIGGKGRRFIAKGYSVDVKGDGEIALRRVSGEPVGFGSEHALGHSFGRGRAVSVITGAAFSRSLPPFAASGSLAHKPCLHRYFRFHLLRINGRLLDKWR